MGVFFMPDRALVSSSLLKGWNSGHNSVGEICAYVTIFLTVLAGLVVKASASRAEDPWFESRSQRDFFGVESYYSDLKIGTPVATLPGAWRCRVSAGTRWPGVSIL